MKIKILHILVIVIAAAAVFLMYKKMKEKPIVPMTTSKPLPVDFLDDSGSNSNGDGDSDEYQDLIDAGPVGDYSMSPVASALTARGYMAWFPGNR